MIGYITFSSFCSHSPIIEPQQIVISAMMLIVTCNMDLLTIIREVYFVSGLERERRAAVVSTPVIAQFLWFFPVHKNFVNFATHDKDIEKTTNMFFIHRGVWYGMVWYGTI